MKKTTLMNSSGAPLAKAVEPGLEVVPDTGPKFEAPPALGVSADFPTVHAHAIEVMRRVVAIDDAAFADLFNRGQIMPPETRAATECMRGAIAMYENAAAVAAEAPVNAMLVQAVTRLDDIIGVQVDPRAVQMFGEIRAFVDTARMSLEFHQPVAEGAVEAYVVWNPGCVEGVIFIDDPEDDPTGPLYTTAEDDAHEASTGQKRGSVGSGLARDFYENYGESYPDDDEPGLTLPIQKIMITPPPALVQDEAQPE